MLRERINTETKAAMKAKQTLRLTTLRLINAAIKDKDIAARSGDNVDGVSDDQILAILSKMIKQRRDSATAYEEANRMELAEQERAEIEVIEEFLPRKLDDDEVTAAIDAAMKKVGASSIRDMGKVMAELKSSHAGQMDFGKVGGMIKQRLG
ncbi:GatB/YqeY domain-containing protein [Pontivivens nitratireducens]|uniref:GatB/YqeY domain-containing protein n=1 Tax=Pontivivens nitratireducens TaxID=2758038 RepID=A0A6G7VM03_9RHOB|nr:GatB/YqeY domain-containing protein [Pontibrevibacter nitratireducens]QIK41034.1 GatB/YqeY domain-containing protein [Pontibrevibacter nitratireducens]